MPQKNYKTPIIAYFCLALSMCMVGSNIGIGKIVVAELPVFLFAALRFLIATLILAPGMLRPSFRYGLNSSSWGGLFMQSFFGCFLFSLFMLYGVIYTSATSAGIITSALPSVIALLAWLWLRERVDGRGATAIALAVLGIALLNVQDASSSEKSGMLGNVLVLCAVLAEALFAVFSRRLSLSVHPWAMAFGVNLIGALLFLPLAIPQAIAFDWSTPSVELWYWVLLYSITASVLSFLLWYRGISEVPANVAGLFTGVMPVSAALIGLLVLGELMSTGHLIGMGLVLASILFGAKTRPDSSRGHSESASEVSE
ncbi:DMT family transporter [Pseudomonas tohonis]|uniref:DMT family transporter n=1 Tax=Pseudomonas tohonis TaxID=2725477 RepID=UPI0021D8288B|nr:DMT family transporter [Pseudomonas tohonis]UXY53186.1 DMT family transporter [Pseudomonas tohonis]